MKLRAYEVFLFKITKQTNGVSSLSSWESNIQVEQVQTTCRRRCNVNDGSRNRLPLWSIISAGVCRCDRQLMANNGVSVFFSIDDGDNVSISANRLNWYHVWVKSGKFWHSCPVKLDKNEHRGWLEVKITFLIKVGFCTWWMENINDHSPGSIGNVEVSIKIASYHDLHSNGKLYYFREHWFVALWGVQPSLPCKEFKFCERPAINRVFSMWDNKGLLFCSTVVSNGCSIPLTSYTMPWSD